MSVLVNAGNTATFAVGAVNRGERAAMFVFDEELGLLTERAKGLGFDLEALVASGFLILEQVDAAELTPAMRNITNIGR